MFQMSTPTYKLEQFSDRPEIAAEFLINLDSSRTSLVLKFSLVLNAVIKSDAEFLENCNITKPIFARPDNL